MSAVVVNESLRDAIRDAGLDVETFAQIIEVDPKTVQRWINGDTTPYRKHRKAIAGALNLTEQQLWPNLTNTPAGTSIEDEAVAHVVGADGSDVTGTWAHHSQAGAPAVATLIAAAEGPVDVIDSCATLPISVEMTDALIDHAAGGGEVRILTDGHTPHWEPVLHTDRIQVFLAEIPGQFSMIKTTGRMLVAINLEHDPDDGPAAPLLQAEPVTQDGLFRRLTDHFAELWALTEHHDPWAGEPPEQDELTASTQPAAVTGPSPPPSTRSATTGAVNRGSPAAPGRRWPGRPD